MNPTRVVAGAILIFLGLFLGPLGVGFPLWLLGHIILIWALTDRSSHRYADSEVGRRPSQTSAVLSLVLGVIMLLLGLIILPGTVGLGALLIVGGTGLFVLGVLLYLHWRRRHQAWFRAWKASHARL